MSPVFVIVLLEVFDNWVGEVLERVLEPPQRATKGLNIALGDVLAAVCPVDDSLNAKEELGSVFVELLCEV